MTHGPPFPPMASAASVPRNTQMLSLWDFFSKVFVPFNRLHLPLKSLHKDVCDLLQKALMGSLNKSFICINIPPRVGKTKLMEAASTWLLAYFPDAQIIYTSYSNELAKTSVRYIQQTVLQPWYEELFATRVGDIRQADHFTTVQGGNVYGDGVGGTLTGLGAGLKRQAGGFIVVDDPAKPDEALSRTESDKLRFWFENTLKSRRNSSRWTPIIVCMQRLDTADLTGFLLEHYPDDVAHVKVAAMVNGESIIPETADTASLLATQRVNPFSFASQYLQEPVVFGGNLIKTANFRYYPAGEGPAPEMKIITGDTAMKAKTSSDYSVMQCWAKSQRKAYLVDQIRGKWEPAELLNNTAAFYRKHHKPGAGVAYVAIEETAGGVTLIAELRKRGIPAKGITRRNRTNDKVVRVMEFLPFQETGMVYLPKEAPWLLLFEAECAQFRRDGKSAQDDQVDPMCDAVSLLLGRNTSVLSVVGVPQALGRLATVGPHGGRTRREIAHQIKTYYANKALHDLGV
ncbi:MAG: phage terminase large subunit [Chloroflexota bacterium]|nr:phage terminase large subunit [Chloroflexota bacterium]